MDTRPQRLPMGCHRGRGVWALMAVAMLAGAGLLLQACSDNKGPVGPRNPSSTTGFANTAAEIRVQVAINPNSITPGRRAGVTVLVTNLNGQPLAGKKVQLSVDIGSLDQNFGVTNGAGQFSTFVRISSEDVTNAGGSAGSATVTAFVEGAIGTGTVTFGGNPTPVALQILPTSIPLTEGATGAAPGTCTTGPFAAAGNFTAQFTIVGGVAPFKIVVSGAVPGATVSQTGLYSAPVLGVRNGGFTTTDTITVVDSAGNTATATVVITCTATS